MQQPHSLESRKYQEEIAQMALEFGLLAPQGWRMDLVDIPDPVAAYEAMTQVAQEAEALGYASIWLFDHFHTVPEPTPEKTFECWTGTAGLARDTKRIRIGQMVTCNGYRNPALLAKMASTVDVMSHGRLVFGIGAGWHEHEFKAFGYEFPAAPTRLQQLKEAVQIIRAMWTEDEAVFEGRYYHIQGAINSPKGVQKPHIPLLIGGSGEKVTLKLVAQFADACNISNPTVEMLEHKLVVLKGYCDEIGRDYNSIKRTVLLNCAIADTEEAALAKSGPFQRNALPGKVREQSLIGTPAMIRERLAQYEQVGAQEVIMWMSDATQLDAVRMFAQELIQQGS